MEQIVNEVYAPIFLKQPRPRYIILMGGRGAGRSTVASQYALAKLVDLTEYFRCAIMRFVLGDIRISIFREITDRAEDQGIKEALNIAENAMTIKYGRNTINAVGFRKSSSDQKSKLKSLANYNTVIIEEGEEIPEEDFIQLDDSLRTTKGDITIIICLNPPPKNHWIIKRWFNLLPTEVKGFYDPVLKDGMDDVLYIRTSFLDNLDNLSPQSISNYKNYEKTKPDHYWNMIRGYVPEVVRGRIYSNWQEIPELPHEARLECYGLDFGFSPDPVAIVGIYYYNGGYILDEVTYQTEYLNRHIATVFDNLPKAPVFADEAEPKSIADLKEMGVDIIACKKGSDSIRYGIKKVQSLKISYTSRSKNLKREYENYRNKVDKNGDEISFTDPNCEDHLMDALRYGLSMTLPDDPYLEKERRLETYNEKREREETIRQDSGL